MENNVNNSNHVRIHSSTAFEVVQEFNAPLVPADNVFSDDLGYITLEEEDVIVFLGRECLFFGEDQVYVLSISREFVELNENVLFNQTEFRIESC